MSIIELIELIEHDLLTVLADVIVQQCNCVTIKPHGLSASIGDKFKYAKVYEKRLSKSSNTALVRSVPGTVELCKPSENETGPVVACLMVQISPGKPGSWAKQYGIEPNQDNAKARQLLFQQCLETLALLSKENDWKIIAFPYKIGCGLAGGNWKIYEKMINNFATNVNPDTKVIICKI